MFQSRSCVCFYGAQHFEWFYGTRVILLLSRTARTHPHCLHTTAYYPFVSGVSYPACVLLQEAQDGQIEAPTTSGSSYERRQSAQETYDSAGEKPGLLSSSFFFSCTTSSGGVEDNAPEIYFLLLLAAVNSGTISSWEQWWSFLRGSGQRRRLHSVRGNM